jgi:hypothetical protein
VRGLCGCEIVRSEGFLHTGRGVLLPRRGVRRKASESKISTERDEFLEMERRWLFLLAWSYEFTERLTDFTDYSKMRTISD